MSEQSQQKKQWRVAALMTAPRYENTYCRNVIEQATRECGLKLCVSQGVYYGQCMQGMMEQVIADGCDLILTIDGDSVFHSWHIQRLLEVIASNPSIDALAAIQPRRSLPIPLATTGAKQVERLEFVGDTPLRVQTAHFGLTAFRVSALEAVKKPWFWSEPSSEGGWMQDSDKIDDDIYFWMQWAKAQRTIYIDPGCRIGHCEEMISHYDNDMHLQHSYPAKWHEMQRQQHTPTQSTDGKRRVNIGGGTNPLPGYEVIDRSIGKEAYPIAEPDNTFDEIRASHVLEHFGHREVPKVLAEWVRILKPGGVLKISVPDLNELDPGDPKFEMYLMGGQTDENDFHKSVFTRIKLIKLMGEAGLLHVRPWKSTDADCSRYGISLNLQGVKACSAT